MLLRRENEMVQVVGEQAEATDDRPGRRSGGSLDGSDSRVGPGFRMGMNRRPQGRESEKQAGEDPGRRAKLLTLIEQ